ncbi:MAG: hypothetical protein K2J87_06985 [Muribaculaceae bacterium]|nr:hypothetical protein [Muribaculaceae bacterium]
MIVTKDPKGVQVDFMNCNGEKESIFLDNDTHLKERVTIDEPDNFLTRRHNLFVIPSSNPNRQWAIGIDGLTLGLSSANGQPHPKGLQWSKSIEIGWLSAVNLSYSSRSSSISLGVGFDWRNYRISTSDRLLTLDRNGILNWAEFKDGGRGKGSRIKFFSIQFPLLYEYAIPKSSVTIKAGPIFNLNTYASVKTDFFNENGNQTSYSSHLSSQRLFTVDLFANISFCRLVGIYFRYSPLRVLNTDEGINFHPLTLGVTLGI